MNLIAKTSITQRSPLSHSNSTETDIDCSWHENYTCPFGFPNNCCTSLIVILPKTKREKKKKAKKKDFGELKNKNTQFWGRICDRESKISCKFIEIYDILPMVIAAFLQGIKWPCSQILTTQATIGSAQWLAKIHQLRRLPIIFVSLFSIYPFSLSLLSPLLSPFTAVFFLLIFLLSFYLL